MTTKIKNMLKKYSLFKLDEETNTIVVSNSSVSSYQITNELIDIVDELKALNIKYVINDMEHIELEL